MVSAYKISGPYNSRHVDIVYYRELKVMNVRLLPTELYS
jgi:hypothetical protein